MLKAIANAIARLFKCGVGALSWAENLVFSPFRAIFSGGEPLPRPDFTPTMSSRDLLEEYLTNRQAQLRHCHRDAIESVMKYAAGKAGARATMDLSSVRGDARSTLLTMDDNELKALAAAGPAKVRRWIEGEDHGIFGVPAVAPSKSTGPTPASSQPPAGMTPQQQILWRVQAHLGNPDHSTAFKLA
ncbi:hypothetical protein ELH70_14630 [Rhizobium ruizarguesonis]|uniref:hypothetical protein n=1 Tax=Rhizobium ruizarguesonis TaxID=2081791 RepID=UPI0010321E9F|nr:hypothetical protein [Rhizobium ruizarguesonis]TAZ73806.1 hypothetical protein ELH70_14630 [Rhizobium ruizarguesonis]TBA00407.1 hypothetical protein ELH69_13815 [Rhizobium ruizarguesonis]